MAGFGLRFKAGFFYAPMVYLGLRHIDKAIPLPYL